MPLLFPNEPAFPEGFGYHPDFITAEEEAPLVEFIASLPLAAFLFHGFEAKRKVLSFGYDYHFDRRSVSKGNPIPRAMGTQHCAGGRRALFNHFKDAAPVIAKIRSNARPEEPSSDQFPIAAVRPIRRR